MNQDFIDFLHAEGWKLVSDKDGFFKFDRVGPLQVYVRNSSIELLKFNLNFQIAGEPFFTLVNSFTGLEGLNLEAFISLTKVMGISNPKSNARPIGTLKIDQQGHCTGIEEVILINN